MADAEKKEEGKEGAADTAASETSSEGSSSKLGLILGALALVVVSAGAPTTFFLLREKKVAESELSPDAASEQSEELQLEGLDDEELINEDEERLGAILPLETFLINLSGGQYLRVQLQLEFVGAAVPAPFVRMQVPIRDGLISLMSAKTASDIAEPQGRDALKRQIKDLINEVMKREEVKRVFFTQFVVQ